MGKAIAQALGLFESQAEHAATTPLMAQYLAIKKQYAEYLLLFRLGDFYELFFEDAVKAASALDIALTKRGKHQGEDIPMCGVPWHQAEIYLSRLIRAGFRVAICEQDESAPKPSKGKTLIERKVVRVITPGTLTEDALLDAKRNNFIVCVAEFSGLLGFAAIDISTGAFFTEECAGEDLSGLLAKTEPGEILIPESLAKKFAAALLPYQAALSIQPDARFNADNARDALLRAYGIESLDGIALLPRHAVTACGALLDYIRLTQQGGILNLERPQWRAPADYMAIDAATARNLELRRKLNGDYAGSLLSCIDRTVTNPGARLLDAWLAAPLADAEKINARFDAVGYFLAQSLAREKLRGVLKSCPDMERALSRLALQRGGPRDLASLAGSLKSARDLRRDLLELQGRGGNFPLPLQEISQNLGNHDALIENFSRALADDLPHLLRDGGFVRKGYAHDLDHLRELRDESQRLVAALQSRYAIESGISNLKVKHNNILGYFIEVPPKSGDKMPPHFIHRQSLATGHRFVTQELLDLEQKISKAADQALAMELEIFEKLRQSAVDAAPAIRLAAGALSALDVFSALAQLAAEENYCRPDLNDSLSLEISGGRHPVVEQALRRSKSRFAPNDCHLGCEKNPARLYLMTGPNMAGKSTFLRQNAIIAILAQMGSFVPADSCRIGLVDKIFSRVGAGDDLARGQSTFMVEMTETAMILNQASPRSLVILDEIGRGTSTHDGLSIAWAVLEYLHNKLQCRGLFATHYHELTALAKDLPGLDCLTMRVAEQDGGIVFLHEAARGVAERSYGLHVAKLAGLPQEVLARAGDILRHLEKKPERRPLPQAGPPQQSPMDQNQRGILTALRNLNLDELSPKAAWDTLDQLRKKAAKD